MRYAVAGLLLASVVLVALTGSVPREILSSLVLGWLAYASRVIPNVTVAWGGVAMAAVWLVLFTGGSHLFVRWLYGAIQQRRGEEHARTWSFRWTGYAVALILLMFVAGLAATGVVHQVGWLLSAKEPHIVLTRELTFGPAAEQGVTNNLKQMGLSVANYISANERLPTGERDAQGQRLHSWQTQILPYHLEGVGNLIRHDLSWRAPENSASFRSVITSFLNPEIGVLRSSDGYALSHYAGNVHVFGSEKPLGLGDFHQGTANTIIAGEAAEGFKPWGDPANLRDPSAGIAQGPGGFAGPRGRGAQMLFLDGSVRFLSKTTGRDVLRTMSIPDPPRTERGSRTGVEAP
jgi:prepilin-type processing-associated H-X9-DG protein